MRLYVTSGWNNRGRLRWLKGWLEKQGHKVISTWHERDYVADCPASWYAPIDLEELAKADGILAYTDYLDETCKGAMDFECGYAFALGRQLWWLGPDPRNVYLERYGTEWPSKPRVPKAVADLTPC